MRPDSTGSGQRAFGRGGGPRVAGCSTESRRWIVFLGGRRCDRSPGPRIRSAGEQSRRNPRKSDYLLGSAGPSTPQRSTFLLGPDGWAGFGPHAGFWSGFGARSEGGFGPEMWRGGAVLGRISGPNPLATGPETGPKTGPGTILMKRGGFGPERWLERAPSEAGQGLFGPHFGAESCYRPQERSKTGPGTRNETGSSIDQHGVFTLAPPPPSSSSSSSFLGPQACRF